MRFVWTKFVKDDDRINTFGVAGMDANRLTIQNIFVTELFDKHSMAALFYLINAGRELELEFKGECYFLSKDGSAKFCSLWKGETEQAFDNMEKMIMYAVIDNRYFYEVRNEIEISTLY